MKCSCIPCSKGLLQCLNVLSSGQYACIHLSYMTDMQVSAGNASSRDLATPHDDDDVLPVKRIGLTDMTSSSFVNKGLQNRMASSSCLPGDKKQTQVGSRLIRARFVLFFVFSQFPRFLL